MNGENRDNDDAFDIEDEIDWAEMQDFFFEDLRPRLDEMDSLCRNNDTTALHRIGHSLKGSGGGVRLPEFTELGKALEATGKCGDMPGAVRACRAIRDEFLKHRPDARAELSNLFEGLDAAA